MRKRRNIRSSATLGLWGLMLVSAVFPLYGCNNAQTGLPSKTDSTPPKWQVSLTINGGLTGQSRSISIDHEGVAQFTDHRNKTQKSSQISVTDLNKLAQLVKNHSSTTAHRKAKSKSCRDCFSYTISTEYDGRVTRQQVNDLTMDENVTQLIGALKAISSKQIQPEK